MSAERSDNNNDVQEPDTDTEGIGTGFIEGDEAADYLLTGLENGTFSAQFPMEKDRSSHKSEAFNVMQLIYENECPVSNWFQCSVCKELLYVKRRSGTQPLLRHGCVKKWKEANNGIETFSLNREQLSEIFSKILRIGFSNGSVSSQQIVPILPKDSTPEQWERIYSQLQTVAEPTGSKNLRINLSRCDGNVNVQPQQTRTRSEHPISKTRDDAGRKRSTTRESNVTKRQKKDEEDSENQNESQAQVQSKNILTNEQSHTNQNNFVSGPNGNDLRSQELSVSETNNNYQRNQVLSSNSTRKRTRKNYRDFNSTSTRSLRSHEKK